MARSKLARVKTAITFLELKGLDHIDFDMNISYSGNVRIAINYEKLTAEEIRQLKQLFGPWKVDDEYGVYKCFGGQRKLDDDLEINLTLTHAYVCEPLDPKTVTDEKLDEVMEKFRNGEITIPDCKLATAKDEEDED